MTQRQPFSVDTIEDRGWSSLKHAALAVVVAGLLFAVFHHGREAMISFQRLEALALAQETRAFCTGLGLAQDTDVYQRCESGLAAIRLRLEQRLAAETAGLM